MCNELEDICNGVFLLGELSTRTSDRIVSFGELISSQIVAAKLSALGISNAWKDSRKLIRTDSDFGFATVDFPYTNKQVSEYFKDAKSIRD